MQVTEGKTRFARTQIEAILVVLTLVAALSVILRYGNGESIVAVGTMGVVIFTALILDSSLDRARWTAIAAALACLWIVCVPIHALVIAIVE